MQTAANRLSVNYTDNFSDAVNRNTYAYPTTVTDPEGYTATSKIHYLTGLVDETQGPKAGQTSNSIRGAINKTYYDSIDRVQKTEILYPNGTATGAYMRYEYPISMTEVKTYTKLDGGLAEAFSLVVLDGHSRIRATASELPNSSGGYSGRTFLYDNVGRNWKSSLPAETSASGNPNGWTTTGDDAAAGWLYTTETFDWKGRSLVMTNTDGTTNETLYEGCGCAGGNTVVTRDEVGRRQKVTYDNFGRSFKAQILQIQPKTEPLNGNGDPYSTIVNSYNVLDQTTGSKTYDGNSTIDYSCPTGICQESTLQYDGFNRQWKTHAPQQDANTYTTATYNGDGTVYEMQDARGTRRTFTYNNRKLPMVIHYTTTGNILNVGDVTFQYDAVGNQTQMDDDQGLSNYVYDTLSRMTSESRFYDNLGTTYGRNYSYNGAGLLTGVLDPNGGNALDVTYVYDKIGRNINVNNGGYGSVSSIISDIKYRAWGNTKEITYGNTLTSVAGYNNRLQPTTYELRKTANPSDKIINQTYQYTTVPNGNDNDGNLKFSTNLLNSKLNRTYTYDFANRMVSAKAGVTITSGNGTGRTNGPFEQTYSFDVFGNTAGMSDRSWFLWYGNVIPQFTNTFYNYSNNRRTTGSTYDADGRVTQTIDHGRIDFAHDVVGDLRLTTLYNSSNVPVSSMWTHFDGEGKKVKTTEWANNQTTDSYYFYSTVLGKLLFELDGSGGFKKAYAYSPSGELLARQENNVFTWVTAELQGATTQETNSSGAVTGTNELDPLGRAVDSSGAYNYDGVNNYGVPGAGFYTPGNVPGLCPTTFGVSMSCSIVNAMGIGPQSIRAMLAQHPWSLNNMWIEMAQNMEDRAESEEERRMARNLRDSAIFWNYMDQGYLWFENHYGREKKGKYRVLHKLFPDRESGSGSFGCDNLIPKGPAGANVLANIKATLAKIKALNEQAKKAAENVSIKGEPLDAAAATAVLGVDSPGGPVDRWFESMVDTGRPWDYKKDDPAWEDFGNFNFGAVGAAAGYPLGVLERMAGWVQAPAAPGSYPEGKKPLTKAQARAGIGGEWPYGDEFHDNRHIRDGFAYFNCVRAQGLL